MTSPNKDTRSGPTDLSDTDPSDNTALQPIAITGIGCRYPGDVHDPDTFWQLLSGGVDAITEIPSNRFDIDEYYDPRPATPGKIISRWGGYLKDVDQFDAPFFGLSPREVESLDPQQRTLLEVSWEALEDAGQAPERMAGSSTGIFVGMWINDFENRLFHDPNQMDFYMTTGSGRYTASGRLSYFLSLNGPSLTVDTACLFFSCRYPSGVSEPTKRRVYHRAGRGSEYDIPPPYQHRLFAGSDVIAGWPL